ncbi:hypothetical protein [Micromonospora ureilytica]
MIDSTGWSPEGSSVLESSPVATGAGRAIWQCRELVSKRCLA